MFWHTEHLQDLKPHNKGQHSYVHYSDPHCTTCLQIFNCPKTLKIVRFSGEKCRKSNYVHVFQLPFLICYNWQPDAAKQVHNLDSHLIDLNPELLTFPHKAWVFNQMCATISVQAGSENPLKNIGRKYFTRRPKLQKKQMTNLST